VCYDGQDLGTARRVGVLALPNLKLLGERGFRSVDDPHEPRLLAFQDPLLDARNERLLVQFAQGDGVGIIGLRGGVALSRRRMDGAPRLGALDQATGQAFGLGNNSILAFDVGRFRESWRVPLGADIARIFLDHQQHRLLTLVNTDRGRLVWVDGQRVSRLQDWPVGGDRSVLLVDFPNRWLYYTTSTIWGEGGYLRRARLGSQEDRAFSQAMPGHLYVMALGGNSDRSYRAFTPPVGDYDKDTWVGTYQGAKEVRRVVVGRYPKQLIFVPAQDQLYLVYDRELRTLSGSSTPLPRGTPAKRADQQVQVPPDNAVPVDIGASGQVAYYADPFDRVLYKLRLPGGEVLASRRLDFAPSALALDDGDGAILLVDWWGGRLVTVRML
jgi:hypothetical protein